MDPIEDEFPGGRMPEERKRTMSYLLGSPESATGFESLREREENFKKVFTEEKGICSAYAASGLIARAKSTGKGLRPFLH